MIGLCAMACPEFEPLGDVDRLSLLIAVASGLVDQRVAADILGVDQANLHLLLHTACGRGIAVKKERSPYGN